MKKPYEGMEVRFVGVVSTVVNKSGTYSDGASHRVGPRETGGPPNHVNDETF